MSDLNYIIARQILSRMESLMADKKEEKETAVEEETGSRPDAVYYYCPHCKASHDADNVHVEEGEVRCPICGEVYKED